jgi:hypothetical protein
VGVAEAEFKISEDSLITCKIDKLIPVQATNLCHKPYLDQEEETTIILWGTRICRVKHWPTTSSVLVQECHILKEKPE